MDAALYIMHMCNCPAIYIFFNCRLDLLEPADILHVDLPKAMIGFDSLECTMHCGIARCLLLGIQCKFHQALSVIAEFQAKSFPVNVPPPTTPQK